ncbi:type VI secretion system amidase immunity protein Tai4 [Burkholderia ubonensis]|uniref:type VI secretion system amidase immunity protein Tai4 n=1 Tax=Burkholderia ubonensis TaxID=101571 RepID=UPI0009B2F130|nr:type VI secretion system amidase immunity protein Tai4 [Burkholderia ubonensis]
MKRSFLVLLIMFALMASTAHAKDQTFASPRAGARTYAQNYRDMILVTCIATAHKNDKDAPIDAGSSANALRDWTSYDMEKSPDAVKSLVDRYLARNYHNPLVESEIKGVRFDFLKCLDLYHSKELDSLVKRLVINPGRTYRQDNASQAARK